MPPGPCCTQGCGIWRGAGRAGRRQGAAAGCPVGWGCSCAAGAPAAPPHTGGPGPPHRSSDRQNSGSLAAGGQRSRCGDVGDGGGGAAAVAGGGGVVGDVVG